MLGHRGVMEGGGVLKFPKNMLRSLWITPQLNGWGNESLLFRRFAVVFLETFVWISKLKTKLAETSFMESKD